MANNVGTQWKQHGKRFFNVITTLPGLYLLLILYNIFGALVFLHIENRNGRNEERNVVEAESQHSVFLTFLYKINNTLASPEYEDLKNESEALIKQFEDDDHRERFEDPLDFWKSLFFCVSMLTTIGYGNICPSTTLGKIGVVVYCIFGIPLAFIVLARTGKKLTRLLTIICYKIRIIFCFRQYFVQKSDKITLNLEDEHSDEITKPITDAEVYDMYPELPVFVPIIILIMYMLLGAVMFSVLENWNYFVSVYFVFVSLSTIGFGDFVPSDDRFYVETSFFVFIGLILVSTCINTVILKYFHPTARAAT